MEPTDKERKKELEKILEKEKNILIASGERLVNKTDKRILLEKALKNWEQLPDFIKNKIKQKNNYIKDYLEKEYIDIAKKYKKDEETKAKWAILEENKHGMNS